MKTLSDLKVPSDTSVFTYDVFYTGEMECASAHGVTFAHDVNEAAELLRLSYFKGTEQLDAKLVSYKENQGFQVFVLDEHEKKDLLICVSPLCDDVYESRVWEIQSERGMTI